MNWHAFKRLRTVAVCQRINPMTEFLEYRRQDPVFDKIGLRPALPSIYMRTKSEVLRSIRTPPRKQPIASSVANVRRWSHALFAEPTPLAAFRELDIPVLYMNGGRSTASAHGVARILLSTLPQVQVVRFDALGHMGPITHPEVMNAAIKQFLKRA